MDATNPVEITKTEEDLIVMMRDFPELFNNDSKIETQVIFNREQQRWELKVGGFYKHGSVTVFRQPSQDFAVRGFAYHDYQVVGRYGDLDTVQDFNGLVTINYYEWHKYSNAGVDYAPDNAWLSFLEKSERVTRKVETRIVPAV